MTPKFPLKEIEEKGRRGRPPGSKNVKTVPGDDEEAQALMDVLRALLRLDAAARQRVLSTARRMLLKREGVRREGK